MQILFILWILPRSLWSCLFIENFRRYDESLWWQFTPYRSTSQSVSFEFSTILDSTTKPTHAKRLYQRSRGRSGVQWRSKNGTSCQAILPPSRRHLWCLCSGTFVMVLHRLAGINGDHLLISSRTVWWLLDIPVRKTSPADRCHQWPTNKSHDWNNRWDTWS